MDSEGKFWAVIWTLVTIIALSIVFGCVSYWKHHNEMVAQLVSEGVNPVAVKCALQDDYGTHPVCLVLAAK